MAWTVHHATPYARATSATARPESTTASSTAALSRVVHRARAGSSAVVGVNVRRGHHRSPHTSRGLRTTTSTRPACGRSRTRCTDQACTRLDTTPHSEQPRPTSTGCTLTRRPPKRQVDRINDPVTGQVEDHARSVTLRAHKLKHSSWPFLGGCLDTPISAQGHEPLHQQLTTPNREVPVRFPCIKIT